MQSKIIKRNSTIRLVKEYVASNIMLVMTIAVMLIALFIGVALYLKSLPILEQYSLWDMVSSVKWKPLKGEFGFLAFILATVEVTLLAILWALPISLFSALYMCEYAPRPLRRSLLPILDILASIPSVVYGLWGIIVIVPFIGDTLAPMFGRFSTGYSLLAGVLVLGVMILPLLISLFIEIIFSVPASMTEASLALGATHWQTIKNVILRRSFVALAASTALAISRALGETIAVLMVCGNIVQMPFSLLDGCYPLTALIANNYGEMLSMPLYESALMLASLMLFVVVVITGVISNIILNQIKKKIN